MIFYTKLENENRGVLLEFDSQKAANRHMYKLAKLYDIKLIDCMPFDVAEKLGMITGKEKLNLSDSKSCEIKLRNYYLGH